MNMVLGSQALCPRLVTSLCFSWPALVRLALQVFRTSAPINNTVENGCAGDTCISFLGVLD